jgi:two-component system, LytTR family, response regulator LytT
MKIIIIEDEKLTAKDLKRTIESVEPDAEVTTVLHSVEEAIEYFKTNRDADLIFSDIQLGDGLSFDIFKKSSLHIPVVFCTAYDAYLFEAFQAAGIDYILKPFSKVTVAKAFEKFHNLKQRFSKPRQDFSQMLEMIESKFQPKKQAIVVRHRDKIIPLDASAIAVLFIEHGGTYAYTFDEQKYLVGSNLEELELSFAPDFFRANRQFLVNRKAIKDASQHYNRKMQINLNIPFKEEILVGKLKITQFLEWLEGG